MYFFDQHKKYCILSLITLGFLLLSMGIHNYFVIQGATLPIRITLKLVPLLFLFLLLISYFFIYRLTIYTVLILSILILCFLADILTALYDPSLIECNNNKRFYFIMGGSVFFVARILLTLLLAIKPYKQLKLIPYNRSKLLCSHILCFVLFGAIGSIPLIFEINTFNILIFIYILLGFGIPFSYSILKLSKNDQSTQNGEINMETDTEMDESTLTIVASILSIFLFNLSDYLLLFTLSIKIIPDSFILISNDLYWLSLFFLVFSSVRSPHFYIEKGYRYLQLNLTLDS
jgi:hypothetical protein